MTPATTSLSALLVVHVFPKATRSSWFSYQIMRHAKDHFDLSSFRVEFTDLQQHFGLLIQNGSVG